MNSAPLFSNIELFFRNTFLPKQCKSLFSKVIWDIRCGILIFLAGYSEDTEFSQTTASDRRKKYLDKSGRHSLDDSSQDKMSTSRIKPASSESRLSGSDKPSLNVPEGKRSSSRLSLLGDKLMDTAKSIGDKKTKTGRSPFPSIFKKNKGVDIPSQDGKRTRSVEYGSIMLYKWLIKWWWEYFSIHMIFINIPVVYSLSLPTVYLYMYLLCITRSQYIVQEFQINFENVWKL